MSESQSVQRVCKPLLEAKVGTRSKPPLPNRMCSRTTLSRQALNCLSLCPTHTHTSHITCRQLGAPAHPPHPPLLATHGVHFLNTGLLGSMSSSMLSARKALRLCCTLLRRPDSDILRPESADDLAASPNGSPHTPVRVLLVESVAFNKRLVQGRISLAQHTKVLAHHFAVGLTAAKLEDWLLLHTIT